MYIFGVNELLTYILLYYIMFLTPDEKRAVRKLF